MTAPARLHAAVHRKPTDTEWGVLLTRADAVALDAWIAAHCDEHGTCRADGCGVTFCDPCGIGEPGWCPHGHDLCADHWPHLCGDCVAELREDPDWQAVSL